jgi:hypothetical protein
MKKNPKKSLLNGTEKPKVGGKRGKVKLSEKMPLKTKPVISKYAKKK